MPFRNFEMSAWIREPPEFTYESGLFHITQKYSDGLTIERVMSPHIFMLALRRAAECARLHKFGGAQIIDFPVQDEESAASH